MSSPQSEIADLLSQAKTYPYDIPESSYAFAMGEALPLIKADLGSPLESEVVDGEIRSTLRAWAERHNVTTSEADEHAEPLLAYGSNASVEGLGRKFANHSGLPLLPVAKAMLLDFDVVYSAHISAYSAIPATLQYSPGSRAPVSVLVANPSQRRMLRKTEPNYILAMLNDIDLKLNQGSSISSMTVVLSRHGLLSIDGSEVAVAASATSNRMFPAMTEDQVLCAVRDVVAPGTDLDEFIVQNVLDRDLASRRTSMLRSQARDFSYPSWELLDD